MLRQSRQVNPKSQYFFIDSPDIDTPDQALSNFFFVFFLKLKYRLKDKRIKKIRDIKRMPQPHTVLKEKFQWFLIYKETKCFVCFLCLMTYQISKVIWCQSHPCGRTAVGR